MMNGIIFKKKREKINDVYNICSNKPIKITKIINFFKRNIGKVKIKKINRNKLDVKNTHGNNLKIKKATKFKSFTQYYIGVKNSYKWYKKNKIYKI